MAVLPNGPIPMFGHPSTGFCETKSIPFFAKRCFHLQYTVGCKRFRGILANSKIKPLNLRLIYIFKACERRWKDVCMGIGRITMPNSQGPRKSQGGCADLNPSFRLESI